jgi:Fic family protein
MKLPARPPPFSELLRKYRSEEIAPTAASYGFADDYLHWDDLRRKKPPDGLTPETWWTALKLTRVARLRPIPLEDTKGRFFCFGVPEIVAHQLHLIDRDLGFSLDIPGPVTRPEVRDQYIVSSLIQESITSSQLEGAATTRAEAKEMLRTGRPPRDKSERMILNNYLTMRRIRELQDTALTPEVVFDLHRRVTEETLDRGDAAGRFRRADENVRVEDDVEGTVFHQPPPARELPVRLEKMCAFANGDTPNFFIHPVIRAIILHFWLAYDHPFVDGNGRTARALFYWSMLRQKYRLFEFISISQILLRSPKRYAEAFLHTETDENDLTYFILHQSKVIQEAIRALHDYVARKTGELRSAETRLHGLKGLNHRQQALLAHALRVPRARYVIAGHQRTHSVTHQTARDDLFNLVERGLLIVDKEGRIYVFHAPADLGDKLTKLAEATRPPAAQDPNLTLPFRNDPLPGQ